MIAWPTMQIVLSCGHCGMRFYELSVRGDLVKNPPAIPIIDLCAHYADAHPTATIIQPSLNITHRTAIENGY